MENIDYDYHTHIPNRLDKLERHAIKLEQEAKELQNLILQMRRSKK